MNTFNALMLAFCTVVISVKGAALVTDHMEAKERAAVAVEYKVKQDASALANCLAGKGGAYMVQGQRCKAN